MPKIQIHDEPISGAQTPAIELEFSSGKITARELIASRVEEEVRRHNAQMTQLFAGLVQPSDSEKQLNGYRLKSVRRIEPDAQIERAFEAFERNGFFLLVDEKQVESLDEELEIGLETRVSFVKLLPLVGG